MCCWSCLISEISNTLNTTILLLQVWQTLSPNITCVCMIPLSQVICAPSPKVSWVILLCCCFSDLVSQHRQSKQVLPRLVHSTFSASWRHNFCCVQGSTLYIVMYVWHRHFSAEVSGSPLNHSAGSIVVVVGCCTYAKATGRHSKICLEHLMEGYFACESIMLPAGQFLP